MESVRRSQESGNSVDTEGVPSTTARVRGRAFNLTLSRWVVTMAVLSSVSLLVMIGCLRVGVENIGFSDAARILFRAVSDWHREVT